MPPRAWPCRGCVQAGNTRLGATRLRGSAGLRHQGADVHSVCTARRPSFLGNPDLKPERSRGFDVAIEQRFARDRVGIEATYFANHFDDLISLGPFDPVTFDAQYFNIGETRASGLELRGRRGCSPAVFSFAGPTRCSIRRSFAEQQQQPDLRGRPGALPPAPSLRLAAGSPSRAIASAWQSGGVFVGSRVDTDFNFPTIPSNEGYATWNASGEVRFAPPHGRVRHHRQPRRPRLHGASRLPRARPQPCAPAFGRGSSMSPMKAAISWSGGKDSCAAYHRARADFDIVAAITMFNEDGTRSRSHGLRPEIRRRADRAAGPAADHRALHVGRPTTPPSTARSPTAAATRRDPRHLRRHPVRRASRSGPTAAAGPRTDGGRAALESNRRPISIATFSRSGGRARIVTVRTSELDESFLGRELADGPPCRVRRARRRSVRRARRISHRRHRLPGFSVRCACARGTRRQQRLRGRGSGAR